MVILSIPTRLTDYRIMGGTDCSGGVDIKSRKCSSIKIRSKSDEASENFIQFRQDMYHISSHSGI